MILHRLQGFGPVKATGHRTNTSTHARPAAVADAFVLKEAGRNTAAVSVPVFASALASLAAGLLLDMPTAYLS